MRMRREGEKEGGRERKRQEVGRRGRMWEEQG